MKLLTTLLFLLITGYCFPQTLIDSIFGYKDIKLDWTMDSARTKLQLGNGFEPSDEPYVMKYEVNNPQYFNFNGCQLTDVSVRFYKGQLFGIELTPAKNDKQLLNILKSVYGRPQGYKEVKWEAIEDSIKPTIFMWTTAYVMAIYSRDVADKKYHFVIMNNRINIQRTMELPDSTLNELLINEQLMRTHH